MRRSWDFANWLRDREGDDRAKGLARDLSGCASRLWFHRFFTLPEKPIKLARAQFCQRVHACFLCGARRAARNLEAAVPKVIARLEARDDLRPYMVTLTLRNGDDLAERLGVLLKAWRAWVHLRRSPRCKSVSSRLDGGIGSVEVKRGKGGQWHPHVHAVVLAPAGIAWKAWHADLATEWGRLVGQDHASVQFQPVQPACDVLDSLANRRGYVTEKRARAAGEAIGRGLLEVFKYALKTGDGHYADRFDATQTLYGKRLIRSFGSLHDVKLPDDLADDLQPFEGLPYEELFYELLGGVYMPADAKASASRSERDFQAWKNSV